MTCHIIKHPAARTTALYRWETDELFLGPLNPRFTLAECASFAKDFWRWNGRKREKCPGISFTLEGEYSYAIGRADILLHAQESGPVILVHELVHCKGFGSVRNVHPVSFVKEYIAMLARHVGYSKACLTDSAMMRGLV